MSTASSSFDPELIDQTRQQLRRLVSEIEGLSRSEISQNEFYEGFLHRVVAALAAIGGVIWTRDETGRLKLGYQMNLQQTQLASESEESQQRHAMILHKIANGGEATLVQPHSGAGEDGQAANPTEFLLVLAALKSDKDVQAVVEIFQRPGNKPTVERGYLRFLTQMCEIAGEYLKTRHLRAFADRQAMWAQLEQFTRLVHESLDPRQTAYTIANEGRRLIGCDRVTVALKNGSRCRVEAVSGQELIEQRSNTVSMLSKLASIVVAGGEDLWYTGDTSNLPPQIEKAVETYADEAHSKMVAVLPLEKPREEKEKDDEHKRPEYVGALIIEQITDDLVTESMRRRIDVVADHSALALANSREHHELFLLPVWRAIGKSRVLVQARTLPKTLLVVGGVLTLLLVLFLWPAKLNLRGKGTLEPVSKRDVFAEVDGDVQKVLVQHGQRVKKGQLLLQLENRDLAGQLAEVSGRLASTREQQRAGENQLSDNRLTREERERIAGQVAQYRQTVISLETQEDLIHRKMELLKIVSPIDGEVLTWQPEQKLSSRPVEKGQALLTIADETADWEIDLRMPEDRMGAVGRAMEEAKKKQPPDNQLLVSYVLATNPGETHEGRLKDVERVANVKGEDGNVVLMRIAIDKTKHAAEDIRPGAAVTAKVDCGPSTLGYVWFHDIISFLQLRVFYPLFGAL